MGDEIVEGIYFGMPEDEYHAARALSCSGMKHLAVSTLNYWHNNINPNRTYERDTKEKRFGKAAHCMGLEPSRFTELFAPRLSLSDYPDALVITDDLKAFLEKNGLPKTAKKKQELIERVLESGLPAFIWDIEEPKYIAANEGKTFLTEDESQRVKEAASVIAADPYASAALSGGMPEVSFFVRDPESGVMLKARMDYVKPGATIDLKTFSNSRGKPIEKTVFDAIYYENYRLQCVVYHTVRELARQMLATGEIQTFGEVSEEWLKAFVESESHGFGFVFIESEAPFDLRIIQLKQSETPGAGLNVYWLSAEMQMREMIDRYAECRQKYGDSPWREPQRPHVLLDTDIPQLMFSA